MPSPSPADLRLPPHRLAQRRLADEDGRPEQQQRRAGQRYAAVGCPMDGTDRLTCHQADGVGNQHAIRIHATQCVGDRSFRDDVVKGRYADSRHQAKPHGGHYRGRDDRGVRLAREDRKEQAQRPTEQRRAEGDAQPADQISPRDTAENPRDRQQRQRDCQEQRQLKQLAEQLADDDLKAADRRGHQQAERLVVDLIADRGAQHDDGNGLRSDELEPDDGHHDLLGRTAHARDLVHRTGAARHFLHPDETGEYQEEHHIDEAQHIIAATPAGDAQLLVEDRPRQPGQTHRRRPSLRCHVNHWFSHRRQKRLLRSRPLACQRKSTPTAM